MDEQQKTTDNIGTSTETQRLDKDPATGKFLPGNKLGKGNKGSRWLSTMLEEALEQIAKDKDGKELGTSYAKLLIKQILNKGIAQGDNTMIQLIYDRMEGKAPQTIDLRGQMTIAPMTEKQKQKLLELLEPR